MNWLTKLTASHIRQLTPYQSARRLFSSDNKKQIWLNANESPFTYEYSIDASAFNRYPDCQPSHLLKAYADYADLAPNQIMVTRGADEGIELLIRAFCESRKDNILICPPTYGMYAISAQTHDVGVVSAPLLPSFALDVAQIIAKLDSVNIVFICSPNNPTGTRVNRKDIELILAQCDQSKLVVIDEAYIEFDSHATVTELLAKHSNLVILRTLSKAFGLAGLRTGFVLAHSDIIQVLLKVIAPYPIAAPVAQIAGSALSQESIARIEGVVSSLQAEIQRISKELAKLDEIQVMGDQCANFVLFRTAEKDALLAYLIANGVTIRAQSKQLMLENCLRVTVGSKQQNDLFLSLVTNFFNE